MLQHVQNKSSEKQYRNTSVLFYSIRFVYYMRRESKKGKKEKKERERENN